MTTGRSKKSPHFPKISDDALAKEKLKDFLELYNESYPVDIKNIFKDEETEHLLLSIFSNSPYLTRLLFKYSDFVPSLFLKPADALLEEVFAELQDKCEESNNLETLMFELRTAKAKTALTIGFADLAGSWTLNAITRALSDFAELSLKLAVNYLMQDAIAREDLNHSYSVNVAENSGYVVLGMGKLGGFELNYSSDIDLIVLFEPDIIKYQGKRNAQDFFIKLTQKLVKIMAERTADGYVFRTDLRLRPDPGATPVAINMAGAENYYQSIGLNWERAAMIKARPVAGDIKAGYTFLERIRGFVWRKHLDYAAIDDVHAIKKLIHQHHSHSDIKMQGHDVKLGRGGIREIEFYAQIHQLISGGREPYLRIAPTRLALDALCKNRKLDRAENDILQEAYIYLRTLEHRLQMINDDQTHEIPTKEEDIYRLTKFMGYETVDDFESDLLDHLKSVHHLFNNLLQDTHQMDEDNSLSFPLDKYHPDTIAAIEEAGFKDTKKIYEMVQNWLIGRYRACRTERARGILKQLVPDILKAFGDHQDPDASLIKFDDFLSKLPSGVQLFSFIKAQPWLLELLAQITGIAPFLSSQLSRNPLLLDSVINEDLFKNNSTLEKLSESLEEQLKTAIDFQDVLDISRKWVNEGKFQVGLQILRGNTDVSETGKSLALIAEVSLNAMLNHVQTEFAKKHGVIKNSSVCILAMGKLGGYEFTTTSDVDMVVIYDAEDPEALSDGEKQLGVNHYYARLTQNFINGITALTGEGKLYEVDLRLRPSGTDGPLAVNFEAFSEYQKGQAWTWEHMALTRARVISEPSDLKEKVESSIHQILSHKDRDQENLLHEVSKMRKRLSDNFKADNIWAMKHVRGGIIDVEFICQYLLLKHGAEHHEILEKNTLKQITRLQEKGILSPTEGNDLCDACHALQTIQSLLRLCLGTTSKNDDRPLAMLNSLAKRLNVEAIELEDFIQQKQKTVLDLYEKIIEIPAQHLKPHEPVPPLEKK